MTAFYRCDGPDCRNEMGRNQPRLSITMQPTKYPEPNEDGEVEAIFEFYGDGDNHFCSDSCLAAWAMDRAIST
jgi:hypothetical protein